MLPLRIGALLMGGLLWAACAAEPTAFDRRGEGSEDGPPTALMSRRTSNTLLHVDASAGAGGDGSGAAPLQTVAEAVALIETTGARAIIVEPGLYEIGATLRIEWPIEIRGSNVMGVDSDGLPTGEIATGTETRLVAAASLGLDPMILVSRSDGAVLHDVTISNLTLKAGPGGGDELQITKTQDFIVRGNVMLGPAARAATAGIVPIASSGRIVGNYVSGLGCGACVGAGYAASPAVILFQGNRVVNNITAGVLLNGSGTFIAEATDGLEAVIRGNDISHNNTTPRANYGLRVFVLRQDLTGLVPTQRTGMVRATIQGNRLFDNEIGISIDAGFPFRRVGTTCDARVHSGALELSFRGNTLSGSRLTPALISFTRVTTSLNLSTLPLWQYLHDATYTIDDPEGTLAGFWLDHPTNDPSLGPCPADQTNEVLGNLLLYNGGIVGHGRTVP